MGRDGAIPARPPATDGMMPARRALSGFLDGLRAILRGLSMPSHST